MSAMLQANVRHRREIIETTARLRLRLGFSTQAATLSVLSFVAEYVAPTARWETGVHVRHAPLLEPGVPAVRERAIG
jgi:hypothetical protein